MRGYLVPAPPPKPVWTRQVITHALNIKDDVAMAGYRDEDCLGAAFPHVMNREPVVV